jgi:hypothetical protein
MLEKRVFEATLVTKFVFENASGQEVELKRNGTLESNVEAFALLITAMNCKKIKRIEEVLTIEQTEKDNTEDDKQNCSGNRIRACIEADRIAELRKNDDSAIFKKLNIFGFRKKGSDFQ